MPTNFKKSLESKTVILATEAPKTLRIPISLVRCSAAKAAKPNKPKHDTKMATMENALNKVAIRCSLF